MIPWTATHRCAASNATAITTTGEPDGLCKQVGRWQKGGKYS